MSPPGVPGLRPPLGPITLRAATEEWLVAATVATEVPPIPTQSPHSREAFTAEMIPLAIAAVVQVIANRVADGRFPNTALEVVLEPKQFSGVLRGVTLRQAGHRDFWLEAVRATWFPAHVEACLEAWRARHVSPALSRGALWYYSPVGMVPTHRVPSWVADLKPIPMPGLATDYFRFYR